MVMAAARDQTDVAREEGGREGGREAGLVCAGEERRGGEGGREGGECEALM